MSLTIPLRPGVEDYDLQCTLDGVLYTLRFRWNRRAAAWFMDVADEDGISIRASLRVVIDFPLGMRCRHALWPPGVFIAVDTSLQHQDAGLPDLGDRVQLLYFESSELPIDPSNPPS